MWFKNNDRNKNIMDPDTYAKLLNRIIERDAEIATIKAKITGMQLDVDNFNRKLSSKLRELKQEAESIKDENNIKEDSVYFG